MGFGAEPLPFGAAGTRERDRSALVALPPSREVVGRSLCAPGHFLAVDVPTGASGRTQLVALPVGADAGIADQAFLGKQPVHPISGTSRRKSSRPLLPRAEIDAEAVPTQSPGRAKKHDHPGRAESSRRVRFWRDRENFSGAHTFFWSGAVAVGTHVTLRRSTGW